MLSDEQSADTNYIQINWIEQTSSKCSFFIHSKKNIHDSFLNTSFKITIEQRIGSQLLFMQ